jgi:hypothetical protein
MHAAKKYQDFFSLGINISGGGFFYTWYFISGFHKAAQFNPK